MWWRWLSKCLLGKVWMMMLLLMLLGLMRMMAKGS
jgi:hypothetical protein